MSIQYSDGVEVETRILETLRDEKDLCSNQPIGREKYDDWAIRYHLSPERASISFSVKRLAEGEGGPEGARIVIGSRTAAVPPAELDRLFDPVRMVQESLIDIGPAVSQRIVEALGGRLEVRQGHQDVTFGLRLPAAL